MTINYFNKQYKLLNLISSSNFVHDFSDQIPILIFYFTNVLTLIHMMWSTSSVNIKVGSPLPPMRYKSRRKTSSHSYENLVFKNTFLQWYSYISLIDDVKWFWCTFYYYLDGLQTCGESHLKFTQWLCCLLQLLFEHQIWYVKYFVYFYVYTYRLDYRYNFK